MNRREWAIALGSICSPSWPTDAIEALVDMLPLLVDWPDEAFSETTLREVASRKRRQACPAFDEIIAAFREMQERYVIPHRMPASIRLAGAMPVRQLVVPATSLPTPDEIAHVEAEVQAMKSKTAVRPPISCQPKYVSKIDLARAQIARGMPAAELRPDLKVAFEDFERTNQERR